VLKPSETVTKPAVHETHSNAASAEYLPVAKKKEKERTNKKLGAGRQNLAMMQFNKTARPFFTCS
jgi:hypothetical protein